MPTRPRPHSLLMWPSSLRQGDAALPPCVSESSALSRPSPRLRPPPLPYAPCIFVMLPPAVLQGYSEYLKDDVSGVRVISKAHALEDTAQELVVGRIPAELVAKCEAIKAKGGPAPLPGGEQLPPLPLPLPVPFSLSSLHPPNQLLPPWPFQRGLGMCPGLFSCSTVSGLCSTVDDAPSSTEADRRRGASSAPGLSEAHKPVTRASARLRGSVVEGPNRSGARHVVAGRRGRKFCGEGQQLFFLP